MINFNIVAKLSLVKDSPKLKGFETQEYDSGWVNSTVRFNAISGDNRFLMQIRGGKWKTNDGNLYLLDSEGNKFTVPFEDRFNQEHLENTANWRKRVIDLDNSVKRKILQDLVDEEKGYDDDYLKHYGLSNELSHEELEEKLEKSKSRRLEFLSDWDFVDKVYKVLKSDKIRDKKFRITGEIEFQYSESKKKWYKTYVPHKIYLAENNVEYKAIANVPLFFDKDSLNDDGEDEMGKAFIAGYVETYDNQTKSNKFAPYNIVITKPKDENDEKEQKYYTIRKNRFRVDEDDDKEVYMMGIIVDLIDGSQKSDLTVDQLPEDVQEAILMGDISENDAIQQFGGQVYGERITENRFSKLMKGYAAGKIETEYTSNNLHNIVLNQEVDNEDVEEDEEDYDSLFDDID